MVDRAVATYGRLDILINNAGVSWGAPPEDMPLDKWQKVIDINLTGAFLFSQAAGREMLKRRRGCIINVASVAGLQASVHGPHYAGYAASKAGLMGLTRELAASWGPPGHSRERDRARLLPLAAGRSGDCRWPSPASRRRARFLASGAAGELKGVACSSPPTPRATSPARSSSSMAADRSRDQEAMMSRTRDDQSTTRPWLRHYDYWVPPHLTYPGRPLSEILDTTAVDLPDGRRRCFSAPSSPSGTSSANRTSSPSPWPGAACGKGDRVGIMLPNCPQYVIAAFAVLRLGAIVVNVNPIYTAREVLNVARDSGMRAAAHARSPGAARAGRAGRRPTSTASSSPRSPSTRPRARRRRASTGPSASRACSRRPASLARRRASPSRRTMWPCFSTPAARPARRRARC